MGIAFTKEQQEVIDVRSRNVLVSAAAGSGKTAVLVQRILSIISDSTHPVDIDKLLIVTFTNAAASEMRERIHHAIIQKLEENPDDEHLQKQATLVHSAQITTIDSFCLFLLRNHFNEIGIDPGFRVADEGEMNLIKQDVLANVLEEAFQKADPDFLHCVECYTTKGSDKNLESHIETLYRFSTSYPWPKDWLTQCKEELRYETVEEMAGSTWMETGMQYLSHYLNEINQLYQTADQIIKQPDGPYIYGEMVEAEKELFESISKLTTFSQIGEALEKVALGRLSSKKDDSIDPYKRELVKEIRKQIKALCDKILIQFFLVSLEKSFETMQESHRVISVLVSLTLSFMDAFSAVKKEKKLIDFSDMEHFALEILLEEKDGKRIPGKTALSYQEYFYEIMIDEYQDSNLVQELLLQSISGEEKARYNRFMVGDIKQSIYKFRLARPEIFMEKFENYAMVNPDHIRIDLHKNFRSRDEVIDSVNDVFHAIMNKEVGGVLYDEKAALNLGASYPDEGSDYRTELLLFEGKVDDKKQAEAGMIAKKIKEMVGTFLVTDKQTQKLRPAQYRDVVILLRSNAGWDEVFKKVLQEQGIPVYISSKTGYFSASEIRVLLNMLKVLDNPLQDIPLAGLMKSYFFSFSDEEMAYIKGSAPVEKKYQLFYETIEEFLGEPSHQETQEKLCQKLTAFLDKITLLREKSKYLSIHQLLQDIFQEFHYLEYVSALPGGEQRKANVEMFLEKAIAFEKTSFQGLFHFIRYMEQLNKYDVDFGEAGIAQEHADTVRIMTIHKSKGLEFPICFVSGLAKKFNMQDTTKALLLDVDMGIATDYIDPVQRIRQKTIRKNIVARKMQIDNVGEELRVLYVALTRAKEKLIMTAAVEDVAKLLKPCRFLLDQEQTQLSFSVIADSKSYLELIMASLCKNEAFAELWQEHFQISPKEKEVENKNAELLLQILHQEDLEQEVFVRSVERGVLKQTLLSFSKETIIDAEKQNECRQKFSFVYPNEILQTLYVKTSVSELKHAAMHIDEETNVIFETQTKGVEYIPSFAKETEEMGGTNRGNAYHKVMELLNFTKYLSFVEKECSTEQLCQEIKKELDEACESKGLQLSYRELVNEEKIAQFLQSNIGRELCKAAKEERLFREKPFVMRIPATRLNPEFPEEEFVLIQGIIDAFFVNEEGEMIVLDYKTDRIASMQELEKRYRTQLDYYEEALSKIKHQKVKEKVLYSFSLGQEYRFS